MDDDIEEVTRRLSIRLAGEAVKIGQALGYELETINKFAPDEWVAAMDGDGNMVANMEKTMKASIIGRSDDSRPSMAQDIAKKRRTEINSINGFIVQKGKEIGVDAPANEGLVNAVQKVETGAEDQNLDLVRSI